MAKAFGLSRGGGALIGDVSPQQPGGQSGNAAGRYRARTEWQPVTGPNDLSIRVSEMAPGSVAHLTVFRGGQRRNIDVTLGQLRKRVNRQQRGAGRLLRR